MWARLSPKGEGWGEGDEDARITHGVGMDASAPGGRVGTFFVSPGLRNGYIRARRFYGWALASAADMRSSGMESSPGRGFGGGRSGGPAEVLSPAINRGVARGGAGGRRERGELPGSIARLARAG